MCVLCALLSFFFPVFLDEDVDINIPLLIINHSSCGVCVLNSSFSSGSCRLEIMCVCRCVCV